MNPAFTRVCALLAVTGLIWQGSIVRAAYAQHVTPNVVVAQPVLMPIIAELLNGVTTPEAVLIQARDSHDALLTPSDVKKLANADIIIAADDAMTPSLMPWLKEKKNPRAMVLILSRYDEANIMPIGTQNAFLPNAKHAKPKDATNPANDPHVWLDPLRVAALLAPLAKDIASYNPEFSATLHDNAQKFARHLRAVTYPKTRAMLAQAMAEQSQFTPNYPIVPVLTQHNAFAYFYDRYGVKNGGYVVSQGTQGMGAASTTSFYKAAQSKRIRCVFISEPSRLMARIAEKAHARTVLLNPEQVVGSREVAALGWFKNDYDRFIANVTDQFANCLR